MFSLAYSVATRRPRRRRLGIQNSSTRGAPHAGREGRKLSLETSRSFLLHIPLSPSLPPSYPHSLSLSLCLSSSSLHFVLFRSYLSVPRSLPHCPSLSLPPPPPDRARSFRRRRRLFPPLLPRRRLPFSSSRRSRSFSAVVRVPSFSRVYVGKALDISGRRPRETQFLGACSATPLWTTVAAAAAAVTVAAAAAATADQTRRYLAGSFTPREERERRNVGVISGGDAGGAGKRARARARRLSESGSREFPPLENLARVRRARISVVVHLAPRRYENRPWTSFHGRFLR